MKKLVYLMLCGVLLAVLCMSVTSCEELNNALFGSSDNPSEIKVDVDQLTPEQIAQAVKLLEDVQKEGAQLTVSFTYKTVDYDATFEKKGDDYELLSFMSGTTPANVDFKPYLTLTIPDDWTEEDIDNYIVVPGEGDGLIVDEDEDEGDEDDGDDEGDDDDDDDDDDEGDDDEGDDDDGEADDDDDEGGIRLLTRGAVEIPALDFVFGLAQSESDDLVQAQISTKEATATLVGDYENFDVKNLTMPASGSVASTRAAQEVTVYLVQKQGNKKDYKIKSVTLDHEIGTLECTKSETFTASYNPENAKIYKVQWKTSNTNVLSVQPLSTFTAKVTALAAGKATIHAIVNGKDKKISIKVPEVPVESLTLNEEEAEVAINPEESKKGDGYLQLQATISPDYATKKALQWKSSNKNIAKVDKNGLVRVFNKKGKYVNEEVTITCTPKNKNDKDKFATCKIKVVTVDGFVFVDEVKLNSGELTLNEGDETTLEATLSPGDATNLDVTWTSSKPSVATVDQEGKVTALKAGKTTITVRALGSQSAKKKATCKVMVNALPKPTLGPSGGFGNGGDPTK